MQCNSMSQPVRPVKGFIKESKLKVLQQQNTFTILQHLLMALEKL